MTLSLLMMPSVVHGVTEKGFGVVASTCKAAMPALFGLLLLLTILLTRLPSDLNFFVDFNGVYSRTVVAYLPL